MKISFVIPVYNNEGSLEETANQIKAIFKNKLKNYIYEIIFIEDGSKDNSINILLNLRKNNKNIKIIKFKRNFGQLAAQHAGFINASGNAIINISADLQDPISLVPEMINKWEMGSQLVICHRIGRDDDLITRIFSKIAYWFISSRLPANLRQGFDYLLIDDEIMKIYNNNTSKNKHFQAELLWTGATCSFIPYVRQKRIHGKSQYSFTKKLKLFFDAFLSYSYTPLRLIMFVGLIFSTSAFFYSISIIFSWLRDETPFEGWAPIMLIILFSTGLILFMMGIIGEYIVRILDEVKQRPEYIIDKKIF